MNKNFLRSSIIASISAMSCVYVERWKKNTGYHISRSIGCITKKKTSTYSLNVFAVNKQKLSEERKDVEASAINMHLDIILRIRTF